MPHPAPLTLPDRFFLKAGSPLRDPAQQILCEIYDKADRLARGYFNRESSLTEEFARDLAILLESTVVIQLEALMSKKLSTS